VLPLRRTLFSLGQRRSVRRVLSTAIKYKKESVDKTERDFWLVIRAILLPASALALAWYDYIPR
jgi:hypothetical protein